MGRELRRVALDFDFPLGKTWTGFLNPYGESNQNCEACDHSGLAPDAKKLHDQWYGNGPFHPSETGSTPYTHESPAVRRFAERNVRNAPDFYGSGEMAIQREGRRLAKLFNGQWSHHLDADDVKALIESDRLTDFIPWAKDEEIAVAAYYVWENTGSNDEVSNWYVGLAQLRGPYPSPAQVNEWSIGGFGHDSINNWKCVRAKAERMGVPYLCSVCNGEGSIWTDAEDKARYDAWEPTDPPAGEGYQMWQTVSEGGPVTPVFDTAFGLIAWLVCEEGYSTEAATEFVTGDGWVPSAMMVDGKMYRDLEMLTVKAAQ